VSRPDSHTGAIGTLPIATLATLTTLLLATLAAACGLTGEERGALERKRETGYRGVLLAEPIPVPDFTLTDTEGRPFRWGPETAGRLALLFFGYSYCPDICPVQMANLAAVLGDLSYRDRNRIRVIFVTTDPERDTPERLRGWLQAFDPSFVGLRGEIERVNEILAALGLPPAVIQGAPEARSRADPEYTVGHASQVIAVTADGLARVVYPSGIRQADWAHDLPKLLEVGATTPSR